MTAGGPPLIVHVIYRLDYGGLENGVVNLVNNLSADRYRHAIVCLAGSNPAFRARIRRPDVEVLSLDKRPGKDPAAYARFWRILRRLRPAVVHTRNLGTVDLQWVAAAARVRNRVHGEHGWEAADPRGLASRGLHIRRLCRPVIHRYVPMSRDIARWLEHDVGVEPARIRQIYSGVDERRFHPPAEGPPEAAADAETVTVGTVGRLDPVKNQVALIRAIPLLAARVPGLRLVIVGDGPLAATLRQEAERLGVADRVQFAGARDDTPDWLRRFAVFALPSINEGISNTILEAMASGLPVVAGRVGGNPELVVDGVSGRLYDASHPEGLAEALLPYLTDPALRRLHGAAGRARVVQNFGLEAMVRNYRDLYDELTGHRPGEGA